MFGSIILDVAVGLVIVYLLLSFIATSIRESIAGILNTRAHTLHDGIMELLGDKALVEDLYNHPVISSLYRGADYATARKQGKLPAYIPARSFSAALIDMVVRGRDTASALQSGSEARLITPENVRMQIGRIGNTGVQRAILSAVDSANGDLNALYLNVEHWFDSTMDRVSGWYKRHTQMYLFFIGLALAVLANADSVRIAKRLYVDPGMRQTAIALAGTLKASDTLLATTDSARAVALRRTADRLDSLEVPLYGWSFLDTVKLAAPLPHAPGQPAPATSWHWSDRASAVWNYLSLSVIAGWFMTALAISLGAPFWFDTLGRIMVIRNTVKPNQKSPNVASDDRQDSRAAAAQGAPGQAVYGTAPPTMSRPAAAPSEAAPAPDFTPQEWAVGFPKAGVA